jgi:prepilin-type N-terminal cleavage/methylation domain-containing protein
MTRRAHPRQDRGFTLLEMCMVLFIMAMLVAGSMPAIRSALTEQALRRDSQQLAQMVKLGMIRSAEQHRTYIIELTDNSLALHPAGEAVKEPAPAATAPDDESDIPPIAPDVDIASRLDSPNKLLFPDPQKANVWISATPTQWTFLPGELCPATRVRMTRGDAYVEMSFNALTGNVENETSSVP